MYLKTWPQAQTRVADLKQRAGDRIVSTQGLLPDAFEELQHNHRRAASRRRRNARAERRVDTDAPARRSRAAPLSGPVRLRTRRLSGHDARRQDTGSQPRRFPASQHCAALSEKPSPGGFRLRRRPARLSRRAWRRLLQDIPSPERRRNGPCACAAAMSVLSMPA